MAVRYSDSGSSSPVVELTCYGKANTMVAGDVSLGGCARAILGRRLTYGLLTFLVSSQRQIATGGSR